MNTEEKVRCRNCGITMHRPGNQCDDCYRAEDREWKRERREIEEDRRIERD